MGDEYDVCMVFPVDLKGIGIDCARSGDSERVVAQPYNVFQHISPLFWVILELQNNSSLS
jgi:hypothetical protein